MVFITNANSLKWEKHRFHLNVNNLPGDRKSFSVKQLWKFFLKMVFRMPCKVLKWYSQPARQLILKVSAVAFSQKSRQFRYFSVNFKLFAMPVFLQLLSEKGNLIINGKKWHSSSTKHYQEHKASSNKRRKLFSANIFSLLQSLGLDQPRKYLWGIMFL